MAAANRTKSVQLTRLMYVPRTSRACGVRARCVLTCLRACVRNRNTKTSFYLLSPQLGAVRWWCCWFSSYDDNDGTASFSRSGRISCAVSRSHDDKDHGRRRSWNVRSVLGPWKKNARGRLSWVGGKRRRIYRRFVAFLVIRPAALIKRAKPKRTPCRIKALSAVARCVPWNGMIYIYIYILCGIP